MKAQLLSGILAISAFATGFLFQTSPAEAARFGFDNIPTSNTNGDAIAGQFRLRVRNRAGNQVLLRILNLGPTPSFIGGVYIDDAKSLLSNPMINSGNFGDVNFKVPNGNLNFPQGNTINFNEDFGYSADKPGSGKQGVDAGESLGILFSRSVSTNEIVSALKAGDLRVGLHVQGIDPNGGSDSFVSGQPVIPTPALLPGLIGLGLSALRKQRQTETVGEEV